MLEYFKTILVKVSFDVQLFEKELKKALTSLMAAEIDELKQWCYSKFSNRYQNVLNRCFA